MILTYILLGIVLKILFTPNPQPGDYWKYMGRRCRIRGITGKTILNANVYVDFLDDISFRRSDWLIFKLFGYRERM